MSLRQAFPGFLRALAPIVLLVTVNAGATGDRVLVRSGLVQVVTPDDATVEQAKTVAKQVKDAWNFDLSFMRWTDPAAMQRPLTVHLVSAERMKRDHPTTRAFAAGSSTHGSFTVRLDLLSDEGVNGTFAHELGHLQAFYAMGNKVSVPQYFVEGHGQMMNQDLR